MRTEAEVKEAIGHMEQALQSKLAAVNPAATASFRCMLDMLQWFLGNPTSRFESDVMEPCRLVDRAERQ